MGRPLPEACHAHVAACAPQGAVRAAAVSRRWRLRWAAPLVRRAALASALHLTRARREQELRERARMTQHHAREGMRALLETIDGAAKVLVAAGGERGDTY